MRHPSEVIDDSDLALLDFLTAPENPTTTTALKRRDADLDPLLLGAAAGYRNVTRNHYCHDFFPAVMDPQAEGSWDWSQWRGEHVKDKQERVRLTYVSRQAPRSQRLGIPPQNHAQPDVPKSEPSVPPTPALTRSSSAVTALPLLMPTAALSLHDLEVRCMARTRVPTPHGPVFLHVYHNNRDNKEHLGIVVDPAQLSDDAQLAPPIRSRSLDTVWSEAETDMDRITRGAYVGRLSATQARPSTPGSASPCITTDIIPSPLVRIHSECFTGETIGSMRCDCGEQLDEAIRLIAQPITIPGATSAVTPTVIPGRGAVVYMRQEGRGIGLLSKVRAYNLQDLGHDTVAANLLLGHDADERGYEIACAILRDLGLGTETGEGMRLLTNNPEKVHALEKEGVRIVERVPMIPRSWRKQAHVGHAGADADGSARAAGATLIGGSVTHGEDLDKYLRTKVLKMGHMLSLDVLQER